MLDAGSGLHPTNIKSKICLVGEEAVGKTSLIHRFVHNVYDESYIRTLGAVAAKKTIDLDSVLGRPFRVDMTILDIMGKRKFLDLFQEAYFHGARGILAVADLTRRPTLDALRDWIEGVESVVGKVPILLVANKADLADRAEYGPREAEAAAESFGGESVVTSAKTGENVEEAFRRLATRIVDRASSR